MIDILQKGLSTSASTNIIPIPGGTGSVTVTNNGANPIYLGLSSTVSTTNGFKIAASAPPVVFPTFDSSKPQVLWGISGTGASSVGVIISNAH